VTYVPRPATGAEGARGHRPRLVSRRFIIEITGGGELSIFGCGGVEGP
jgi:hypothetical protein